MTPLIEVRDVHKSFDGKAVLRGLSLDVPKHQAIVLIGASGSGKSTLLRCMNALVPVDAGTITLHDGDTTIEITQDHASKDEVRRQVGIVFQSFNLFPHMSALENVALAPRKVRGLSKEAASERALELLARFGLAEKADWYPDHLSGGQAQRVAIVRALAMEPQVMLFDEITSALDPMLVGEVLDVVRELKAGGLTMVMATHEMGFARDVADHVCFLADGVVLEEGSAEEVFGSPKNDRTRSFLARI